jgi:hypothetical protein
MRQATAEDDRVITEGMPAILRVLDRCREHSRLAAVTGHIAVADGEVLITVRNDSATAAFHDRTEDITHWLDRAR